MSSEVLLSAEGLAVERRGRALLADVSFQVHAGEIVAVMGASGIGKSSLMRALLGLEPIDTGAVRLFDKALAHMPRQHLNALRQKVGVAYQGGALFSSMTVAENVALPLREHTRLDARTIAIMTRMKLAMMDLADAEDLLPAQLSGGMRKRAGLARAVIMDPRLLFFDEPTAGLDPASAARLDDIILELKRAMNMGMLVITHDLDSAFHIADQLVILKPGGVAYFGPVDQVQHSEHADVINLLQRKVRKERLDGDAYIDLLADGPPDG